MACTLHLFICKENQYPPLFFLYITKDNQRSFLIVLTMLNKTEPLSWCWKMANSLHLLIYNKVHFSQSVQHWTKLKSYYCTFYILQKESTLISHSPATLLNKTEPTPWLNIVFLYITKKSKFISHNPATLNKTKPTPTNKEYILATYLYISKFNSPHLLIYYRYKVHFSQSCNTEQNQTNTNQQRIYTCYLSLYFKVKSCFRPYLTVWQERNRPRLLQ